MNVPPPTLCALAGRIEGDGQLRVRALLDAFHERHVPLTAALAGRLAMFEASPAPARDPYWGRGYLRSSEALGLRVGFGHGAIWRRAWPVYALTVAEPILRRAAQETGSLPLLIEHTGRLGLGTSSEAVARIEGFVERALAHASVMGEGFWQIAGLALHGAATFPAGRARQGRRLPPEIDAGLARLIFGLDPQFSDADRKQLRKIKPQTAARRRSGLRPREGGVAGILRSSRLDDFAEAVASELVMPEELVAQRLLDEGLIIRHRPPRREPMNDLLALFLCDRRTEGEALDLFKAAWIDASLRLGLFLSLLGQPASDLIWSERGPFWQRVARVGPEAFPTSGGAKIDPMAVAGSLRRGLLIRSGLFPEVVDASDGLIDGPVEDGEFEAVLAEMAHAALRRLRTVGTGPATRQLHRRGDPSAYRQRAVIIAVGADSRAGRALREDAAGSAARLNAALRRPLQNAPARLSMVVVPATLSRGAVFEVATGIGGTDTTTANSASTDAWTEIIVPDASDPREALAATLGTLSGFMVRWLLETLDAT